MKSWLIAPLSTLAVTLIPAVSNAATITKVWTPNPSETFITGVQTNVINRYSAPPIPKFDPVAVLAAQPPAPPGFFNAGVSLVGVTVDYTSTIDTRPITITNQGGNDIVDYTFAYDYQGVSFDAPGTGLDVGVPTGGVGFTNFTSPALDIPRNTTSGEVDPPLQTVNFTKSISSELDNFTGIGDFAFLINASAIGDFPDPNGGTRPSTGFTNFAFLATVSYEYELDIQPVNIDTVPEPSSLLGLGLFGLGLGSTVLRKKKTA